MKRTPRQNIRSITALAAALCMTFTGAAGASAADTGSSGAIQTVIDALNQYEKSQNALSSKYYANELAIVNGTRNLPVYKLPEPYRGSKDLPSSYDLRDVDGKCYVPPIKCQDPFGGCWAFAVAAASEISLASALDIDFNTASEEELDALDLSEKHLMWFLQNTISKNSENGSSQAGEGAVSIATENAKKSDKDYNDKVYQMFNYGSDLYSAISLISAGIAPVTESEVPFNNNEGKYKCAAALVTLRNGNITEVKTVCREVTTDVKGFCSRIAGMYPELDSYNDVLLGLAHGENKTYYYCTATKEYGDWSVDEKYRFASDLLLSEGKILPDVCTEDADGNYRCNYDAIDAVKKEICAGHGVSAGFYNDGTLPGNGRDADYVFMNFTNTDGTEASIGNAEIWAQYTYDPAYDPTGREPGNSVITPSHAITIVGYDDNFPKKYFNDPNGSLPGNGAFIARNSWGCITSDDPTETYYWGNNGDGYFYISYYDQSLTQLVSYSYYNDNNAGFTESDTDCYDFILSDYAEDVLASKKTVYSANVFTADTAEEVWGIGVDTFSEGCTASYEVYLLNKNAKKPTDGVKAASGKATFDYKGYHTVELKTPVAVAKGQSYSIVVNLTRKDGRSAIPAQVVMNESGLHYYERVNRADFRYIYGWNADYVFANRYFVGVINPGESFIGVKNGKTVEWADWSDVTARVASDNAKLNDNGFTYDNFGINGLTRRETVVVKNTLRETKTSCKTGETIKGKITIKNTTGEYLNDLELTVSVGASGKFTKKITKLAPGAVKTINYSYKVKKKDASAGSVTSTAVLTVGGGKVAVIDGVTKNSFRLTAKAK